MCPFSSSVRPITGGARAYDPYLFAIDILYTSPPNTDSDGSYIAGP